MPFRFSIQALMGIILFVAFGSAALISPTPLWANASFTLTLAVLTIALLGSLYMRESRRAAWVGATIVGWAYITLTFGPIFATENRPRLLTTTLIDWVYRRLEYTPKSNGDDIWVQFLDGFHKGTVTDIDRTAGTVRFQAEFADRNLPQIGRVGSERLRPVSPECYQQLGHSLLGVILALGGSIVARSFAAWGEREQPQPVRASAPPGASPTEAAER